MSTSTSPCCTIVYSTQSGRARACARRTARILREKTGLKLLGGSTFDEVANPSFVEHAASLSLAASSANDNGSPQPHFFLFFVSTTGDGVHCDSIQATWKLLLKKSLPPTIFQGNSFALFALGDRAYGPQFCAAGRKLAVRLMQLGMTTKCEVGYGDDNTPNGGVFADLDRWIDQQLLPSISSVKVTPTPHLNNDMETTTTTTIDASQYYSVTVQETIDKEENQWQLDWCEESYLFFFSHQSPMTAYSYLAGVNQRIDANNSTAGTTQNNPLIALVESNQRLTASEWDQNTRHLRLRVCRASSSQQQQTETLLPYQAGDVASVLPSNPPDEVERFIQTLPNSVQLIVDQVLELNYIHTKEDNEASFGGAFPHWPKRCTLRGWLTYCADIHAPPEREDLRALSQFCSPEHEMGDAQREKLMSLSETSASALYVDYVLREKRCWTDVLYDFDSLRDVASKLTVEALLMLLPPIRPRDFSIASSPTRELLQAQQKQQLAGDSSSNDDTNFFVELCVALVEGKTPLGRKKYHGLCSHYISELSDNSQVRLWIRPGSFAGIPLAPKEGASSTGNQWFENPVLYIGAGTGVAPLRGLILEREAVKAQQSDGAVNSAVATAESSDLDKFDNVLVFGCRKKEVDYYYQEEWKQLEELGRLFVLPAFSRAQARKVYVQQLIKKNGDAIVRHILENDGAIYIAGNPSMARYSKEELIEATARALGGEDGEKKANILFKKLQARGRFSVEAWS